MDRYQSYIFGNMDGSFSCSPIGYTPEDTRENYATFDKENNILTIRQADDITVTKYDLCLKMYSGFEWLSGVSVLRKGKWAEVPYRDGKCNIPIDFDDRTDAVKLTFRNKLADDCILNIRYEEADKEKYYAKIAQDKTDALIQAADIRVSTGADLVNIYFRPCSDAYKKTTIELYTADGEFEHCPLPHVTPGNIKMAPRKLLGGKMNAMIGLFHVDEEMFFKAITGLARGVYGIRVAQYDKNGKELFKTDAIFFAIR